MQMSSREFNKDKQANFSEWYNTIIYAADLADIRYNVQGFVVHKPWSMRVFKKLYKLFETELEKDGHEPVSFPTVIPEENFEVEKAHAEGFTPEVYWVTKQGDHEMARKLALRPTSETAFYQMYNLWVKSHTDLPIKYYQSCTVFRNESETNPFMRGREFMWIETHDVFATEKEARLQIERDKETTEVCCKSMCLPFRFFKRPHWDTFPGAFETYATDIMLPDGKALQFATTHYLGTNFSKAFNVKYSDEKGVEHFPHTTCFGPGIWRMLAAIIATHGDNKGLVFPFTIAPLQVIIVPIPKAGEEKNIEAYSEEVKQALEKHGIECKIDNSGKTPGYKYNYWELKGVPLRIEIGGREAKEKTVTITRRDNREKTICSLNEVAAKVVEIGKKLDEALLSKAEDEMAKRVKKASTKQEVLAAIEAKCYAKTFICSTGKEGTRCAQELQAFTKGGKIRGELIGEMSIERSSMTQSQASLVPKQTKGKCIECGKLGVQVYVARQY